MAYRHIDTQGNEIALPVNKVVCIGRNYLDHIQEMNATVSEAPLLFMKPKAAMCHMHEPIAVPTDKGECHNELEVSVLLKSCLKKAEWIFAIANQQVFSLLIVIKSEFVSFTADT